MSGPDRNERAERLARALRENLKRRKAQARNRRDVAGASAAVRPERRPPADEADAGPRD